MSLQRVFYVLQQVLNFVYILYSPFEVKSISNDDVDVQDLNVYYNSYLRAPKAYFHILLVFK